MRTRSTISARFRVPARQGFSLIELLVAVAVISIVAAIVLPVFAQVRARARTATCLSNMRQLGAAALLYAQDNDERLPDFHSDPFSAANENDAPYWHDHFCCGLFLAPGQPSFISAVMPYVRSMQIAVCPADTDRTNGGRLLTSYEYKSWLARGRTLAEARQPSGLALFWEQWAYHEGSGHLSEYDRRSAMNVAFLDGHARWRRLADATTSRYGSGPNLHGIFKEGDEADPFTGLDFVP